MLLSVGALPSVDALSSADALVSAEALALASAGIAVADGPSAGVICAGAARSSTGEGGAAMVSVGTVEAAGSDAWSAGTGSDAAGDSADDAVTAADPGGVSGTGSAVGVGAMAVSAADTAAGAGAAATVGTRIGTNWLPIRSAWVCS